MVERINEMDKFLDLWNLNPILMFHKPIPMVMWGPTQNLGLIGSAVLTFIGYKQTNKHPDKPNLYIDWRNLIQ